MRAIKFVALFMPIVDFLLRFASSLSKLSGARVSNSDGKRTNNLSNEQLVIVGGVAAGLAAAMEARRRAPALDITVLEKTGDISYGACGLPYVISGLIPALERLVVHTPAYFHERHQINLQLNTEALEIFPAKSSLRDGCVH